MTANVASVTLREGDRIRINSTSTVFDVRGAGHHIVHMRDEVGKTVYLTRGDCSACPWAITDGLQTFGHVQKIEKVG